MQRTAAWLIIILFVLGGVTRTSSVYAVGVRVPIGPYGSGVTLTEQVHSVKEMRESGVQIQRMDYSCGSAALATIFTSYLSQPYTEAEVINFIARTTDLKKVLVRKGFSLLDLKTFAESHGITAEGYELDYQSLVDFKCPVLVPLYRKNQKIRHFVVFRGATEDRVFLADPAIGRQTMLRSEFERLWSPKVGMVFSHPGLPPAEHTVLGLHPQEGAYLSLDSLRAVTDQVADTSFFHQSNEFKE